MRRLYWVLLAGAVGVGVVAVLRPHAQAPKPSVLLITLDTTRADRLGCSGYSRGATPALDRLAVEGLRLSDALCHVPLTLPSHATILTGLYPPEHGLRDNGRGKLPAGVGTLAETLRKRDIADRLELYKRAKPYHQRPARVPVAGSGKNPTPH